MSRASRERERMLDKADDAASTPVRPLDALDATGDKFKAFLDRCQSRCVRNFELDIVISVRRQGWVSTAQMRQLRKFDGRGPGYLPSRPGRARNDGSAPAKYLENRT